MNVRHLTITTYEAGILQSKAHRALTNFMTESLQKHHLSMPQWTVLGIVYDNKDMRPFQIADRLGVRPPVATVLINELEAKKLVVRKMHSKDSRASLIVLTRQGSAMVSKVEKQFRVELRQFMGDISLPELVSYVRVLSKLAAKV